MKNVDQDCREDSEHICWLCANDWPSDFVETILSAAATDGVQMTHAEFEEGLDQKAGEVIRIGEAA